ncbi:MAG: aminotransferase class IV [Rikenellaceae bacterium]
MTLYQVVHTLNGEIFHLEEHLKILFEAYYELFSSGTKIEKSEVEQQIKEAIVRSRCPRGVSLFVKLSLRYGGSIEIHSCERSLYEGYTLRCISPRVATVEFTTPYIEFASSVREQLIELSNLAARKKGGDIALRLHNGIVDTIQGAQIFAVSANCIITAASSYSVEHKIAKEIAQQIDLQLIERDIHQEELSTLDEIFFIDHAGITSIKSCNGRFYMSIVASALATRLKSLTSPQ